MRKIIVPGELVSSERKKIGQNVFTRNGKIYSQVLGLVDDSKEYASVVALEGKYSPKPMDLILGIVKAEKATGYTVDINSFSDSYISKRDIRDYLKPGTVVSAKVIRVKELNEAELSHIRIFYGGEVISVSSVKVPRIIGKNGSMLEVLKHGTNSSILVGRNGWIWTKGGNIPLLIKAIQKIEREAHLEELTAKMEDFFAKENKSVKTLQAKSLEKQEKADSEKVSAKEVEKIEKEEKFLGEEGENSA